MLRNSIYGQAACWLPLYIVLRTSHSVLSVRRAALAPIVTPCFSYPRRKYLAPMFRAALISQLYCFPLGNVHRL